MSELRRDPTLGYWTIMASERGWRPAEYTSKKIAEEQRECPFCEGKESMTTSEIFAIRKPGSQPNAPGWEVRSIMSKIPILKDVTGGDWQESMGHGVYDVREGIGRHEVVVETPQHHQDLDNFSLEHIQKVIKAYAERIRAAEKNSTFEYALLFKNHGLVSGAARDVIRHSRSQLIALPIIPKRIREQLAMTKNYYERRERCLFCDILRKESAEGSRIVVQNDSFFAYCPFASRSPFEISIFPKKHTADFTAMEELLYPDLAWILKQCLVRLRNLLDDPPYNLILNTAPFRHKKQKTYWKTIEQDYHWSWQITPRLTMNAGFEWGTGIHINPTPPEEAAALLREASGDE